MSVSEAARGVADEIRGVDGVAAPDVNGSTWSPDAGYVATTRCGLKVNDLLATGASYALVLRALGGDNAKLKSVIG